MFKKILIIGCLVFSTFAFAKEMKIHVQDGALTLQDLLEACPEIASSTSSKRVPTDIPGKLISIKGAPYEVRYFSFEDTSGKITPETTFRDYVVSSNLEKMKSVLSTPLPGIKFESFDFRRKTNTPNDGVYFSMAVRPIENGDDKKSSPQS